MGSHYLTELADVARRTGFPVVEVDGWRDRARGSGGYDSGRPNHVIIHHTASGPSSDGWPDVNYMTFNHGDAPLCNLYLSRDGTIYVCAAGASNTNGSGHDHCGITPDDSMNSHAIGIEAGNNGVGEPWPEDQQNAYAQLCVELCRAYGIGIAQIHGHAEWAPSRKIDPAGPSWWSQGLAATASWNMDSFRGDVTARSGGTAPPQPQPTPPPTSGWVCPPYPGTGDYGCSYNTCRAWQDAMILNGVIADNTANHDGVWGNGMHNATLKMQQSWGWSDADGIGGEHSWAHLRSRSVAPCPKCGK